MKILDTFKTILMTLLFFSMVVLAVLCITQTQSKTADKPVEIDINSLLVLTSGEYGVLNGYASNKLIPRFIGYKTFENEKRGIMSNSELITDFYNSLGNYLEVLLGSSSECSIVSEGADKLWDSCFEKSDYIYLRYHNSLPAPVIYAYLTNNTRIDSTSIAYGDVVYIEELIILLDVSSMNYYSFSAVSRSSDGTVATFKLINSGNDTIKRLFDIQVIKGYDSNDEFIGYSFEYESSDYANLKFIDNNIFSDGKVKTELINVRNSAADIIGKTDGNSQAEIAGFLRLFDYNPDRISKYDEYDGTNVVYVEPNRILRIQSDSGISFDTVDPGYGINISDFLGYVNYSRTYTLYEIVNSCGNFIEAFGSIDKALTGGEADIGLGRIYRDNNSVVVEYYYYYDNLSLLGADHKPYTAFRFTVNRNKFSDIEINTLDVSGLGKNVMNFTQSWTLSKLNKMFDKPVESIGYGEIMLAYLVSSEAESSASEWVYLFNSVESQHNGVNNELDPS